MTPQFCQLTNLVSSLLAQEGAEVAPAAADEAQPFLVQLLNNPLLLPAGVLLIFYLTFLGPERRRKMEEAKRLASISKNDRVITSGGIHGTVVNAPQESDVITLRLDESGNVRIKVSRWAIATIVDQGAEKTAKEGE